MQWNFYLSGILYGKFYVKDNDIFVEKLDAAKGIWYPKETFTEESDDFFKKLCSRSLLDFLRIKKNMKRRSLREPMNLLLPPEKPFPTAGTKFIFRDRRNFQRIFFMMRTESMRF